MLFIKMPWVGQELMGYLYMQVLSVRVTPAATAESQRAEKHCLNMVLKQLS